MKKLTISILLLAVMILSITAVSAADDVSLNPDDTQDIDVESTPTVASAGSGVLQSSESPEVLTDSGDKNFTTLQAEIDGSRGTLSLDSNYVRVEGENDILITKTIYLVGNNYKIDANSLGGIFKISGEGSLILQDVQLVNGNATEGGAIYVEEGGYLSVVNSVLSFNNASTGGAIYNKGEASITGSTLNENSADNIAAAIYSEGILSVKDTTFANNIADVWGSSIVNYEGTLALTNINCADEDGIYNIGGRITSKVKVRILNNETVAVNSNEVVINATVEDDNGNTIIDDTLKFYVNDEEVELLFDEDTGNYTGNYVLPSGGFYTVNAVSSTGSTLDVETGIIKCTIGTFTDLQSKINDAIAGDGTLAFDYGFKYVPGIDDESYIYGVIIDDDLTIEGNGYTIDANGAETIFLISEGEVFISNITFINSGYHAIINEEVAELNIRASVFKDNFCPDEGTAGGAAILNKGALFIYECAFENNTATKYGGAICSGGSLTVMYSNFTSNNATYGSAIVAKDFDITGGMFSENIAQQGTVYVAKGTSTITGATFSENECNIGGAIYMINGYLEIDSSEFTGNTAEERAEAIYVASNRASLNITNSVFSQNGGSKNYAIVNRGTLSLSVNDIDNYIYNGGTIVKAYASVLGNDTIIPESDDVVIFAIVCDDMGNTIVDSSFEFVINDDTTISAKFDGVRYTANCTLPEFGKLYTINMSSSRYNELEVLTGAFYNVRGTYTDLQSKIDDAIMAGETLELPYDFTYNEAIDGEYFQYGIEIDDAIEINGNNFTISGNNTSRIFYITDAGSLTIYDATLVNGSAQNGGAILVDEGYLDVDNVIFDGNTAEYGGAIYAYGDGSTILNNSEFTNNDAMWGSAVYVEDSDLTIISSEFIGNDGAVIIDEDSSATIEDSTFEDCGEYPIYSSGFLSLSENIIDNPVFNKGVITSPVYAVVIDNKTYITLDATFPINATLVDDMGNLIYDPYFQFTSNGVPIEEAAGYADGLYTGLAYIGFEAEYVISVDDYYYADLTVLVGIVRNGNVGTYTDLQAQIQAAIDAGEEVFILPYNFTYFEDVDGGKFNSGIVLTSPLTIIGNGNYIDGAGLVRIFDVETDDVFLQDIEFRNGRAPAGGAIYTRADLEIYSCTFINNTADDGNAIYAVTLLDDVANVLIADSMFIDNGDYYEFAISNNNANVILRNNVISNVIYNNGTITGSIIILNQEIVNATFGETINLNATFIDDCGNFIFDPNFVFLVEDFGPIEVEAYDPENGLYTATYVADTLGLKEVDVNLDYNDVPVYTAYLNISTANATLTVNANDILRKQNETITVYLYDLFGNPLNLTVRVEVYDSNDKLVNSHVESTVNGTYSYNVTGLPVDSYSVLAVFYGYGYELTTNMTSFIVDEYILPGSYMDLQRRINAAIAAGNTTLVLPYDFAYIEDCDEDFFPQGVVISAPISIDGNSSVISGNNSYAIFLINASNVSITNTMFMNGTGVDGGAINVGADAANVIISNSMFVNNTATWGGAISWYGVNGTIDNCWFLYNDANQTGGAVLWEGDDGTIASSSIFGSVFVHNTAEFGGAIYVIGDNFVVDGSFISNAATDGGAILWAGDDGIINDSSFYRNNATDGGAVAWEGDDGYINASRFTENNATEVGGAIATKGLSLTVEKGVFKDNTADAFGGAIYAIGDLSIFDSEFANNTADVGNAVAVLDGRLFLLNNTINTEAADVVVGFEGVIASYVNIVILDNTTIDTTEDTIVLNATIVDDMGNLIEADGFEFTINGNQTIPATYNNVTNVYEAEFDIPEGPGIYYINMTYIETDFLDTYIAIIRNIKGTYTDLQNQIDATEEDGVLQLAYDFTYTEAIDGDKFPEGVVINKTISIIGYEDVSNLIKISGNESYRIFYINASDVTITGIEFCDGLATDGGAILIDFEADNVMISQSLFANNTAEYGGAIFWLGNDGIIDMSWFIENEALIGGAVYWAGDNGTITGDDDEGYLGYTLFINNTAEDGGAIYWIGDNGVIEYTGVIGSFAGMGGALFVNDNADNLTVRDAILGNSSAVSGGAVYWAGDNGNITNVIFAKNTANIGGALTADGTNLTVSDSQFIYNEADLGGAIAFSNNAKVNKSLFFGNNATEKGGAIYSISDVEISNSIFEKNTADIAGNAIAVSLGNLYLQNNTINTEAADVVVDYEGVLASYINVTVLGNTTVEVYDFNITLNATVTDDMGNLICAEGFKFIINDEEVNATYNFETNVYEAEYTLPGISIYPVGMTYVEMDNVDVYIGIIDNRKIGTYTDLQRKINIALANGEDLVLPYNFTYNEEIDGDDFPNGVLISGDLVIDGNGFTISSNNSDVNVLTIEEDCVVSIENVIITGVNGTNIDYGAVINHGDLTLNNCTIRDNTIIKASYGNGAAAIFNDGNNLVINGSYIANNSAPFDGSFAAVLIRSAGNVYINDTVLANNSANLGGAIHIMLNKEPVIIEDCLFFNNDAIEAPDVLSDSEVVIFDSYFLGERKDTISSIVSMGTLYLSDNYVEGSVYNSAEGTLALDSNEVTGLIFNYGTITTLTNATFLDNSTLTAQLGEEVFVYGILTDDNGNAILDYRFNITINGVVLDNIIIDMNSGLFYTNYTIEYAGLNVVSTTYDATVINIGIFDVPKANVTEFVVVVGGQEDRIPYGENATVYITLLGIDGIGLNETIIVVVNDVPYTIDVNDGEAQFNVSGLEPGQYSATGLFINNINYNDAYATGLFTILEPEAILVIEVDDTTVGEDVEVTIYFTDADGEPLSGYVTVTIDDWEDIVGLYGETTFYIPGFAVGKYNASVRFDGDERYGRLSNTTTFEVKQIVDYEFDAVAEDTPFNELPVLVTVTLPEDATGNVTLTINGETFNATVEEGIAIIEVSGLDIGEYPDVEVVYSGDVNYAASTTTVDINVVRAEPGLVLIIDNYTINYRENTTGLISINENATGNISVYKWNDDDEKYEFMFNVTVEEALNGIPLDNFNVGKHYILVKYSGNDYFTADSDEDWFIVGQIDPELAIDVTGDLVVDGEVNITFTTPEDVDGIIGITVDGVEVEFTGANGTYTVTLNNLSAGTHTVLAWLDNDTNYNAASCLETFDISKVNITINASADSIKAGNNATIIVQVPEDATGSVLVDIDGKKLYGEISNGIAIVTVPDLTVGNHTATVKFSGDDKYLEDEDTVTITVNKTDEYQINVTTNTPSYSENAVISVTLPADATGNVTVTDSEGNNYTATVDRGKATVEVPNLAIGNNTLNITYSGDDKYVGNSTSVNVTVIKMATVLSAGNVTMYEGDGTKYIAKLTDINGKPLVGETVKVKINGIVYRYTTDRNGEVIVDINLKAGQYNATAIYEGSEIYEAADRYTSPLDVYTEVRIDEAYDLTKDYLDDSKPFKVRALDQYGKPVGEGEIVKIKINGIVYRCTTDKDGYASLAINLAPGHHDVSASYGGFTITRTVYVKSVITAKDTSYSKASSYKYSVTLKYSNGEVISGKTVKFTIDSKVYTATTDSNGVATVTIKQTLSTGKHTITCQYEQDKVSKTITIK